ncbi:lysine--tRNA ligase [Patescibacteria group bacterium]|nr:lysine--tRNA ligase [Patescibacteria group bacterium]
MSTLKDLRDIRIEKLNKLVELGINPFPSESIKDVNNSDISQDFAKYENEELHICGRIISLREHGPILFLDIRDASGKIQLYLKKENINQDTDKNSQTIGFSDLQLLDAGDFIQAKGTVTKTKSGEISLEVVEVKILTKSLRPLPDQHEGLKDKETRFRRRYLDLIINPEIKELFGRKAIFWKKCREFMGSNGFMEVETPVLELVTGGADAAPFVTYHNALDQNFYLRISTELYLKRLVGGGFEKVYTLGPNFRNEGIDDEHLQEFYQLEWYWAYANYRDNMKLVTELYRFLAKEVYGTTKFSRRGMEFDLADKWEELDYATAIADKFDVDIFKDPESKMLSILEKNDISLPKGAGKTRIVDNLWKLIRKEIAGPVYLINIPKFISPLAKSKTDNEALTERFQPIIAGSELGNGYTELNDPQDQLERFLEQQRARDAGDKEAQMLDIDFVEMLEYGMPPVTGMGVSERVFWFLEDVTSREGTLFPQMKYKYDETTKKIYGLGNNETEITETKPKPDSTSSSNSEEGTIIPSREEALDLLEKHVKDEYQLLHAKMVAKVMADYAEKLNENADLWYVTGLLHDLDYFEYPDEHPDESIKWFKKLGYDKNLINAVGAHSIKEPRIEPKTKLAAALIAIDELAGLLYAYYLMRPEGFSGMNAKSIKKKFKDKAFAAKVDRNEISYGIDKLGVDFGEHVMFVMSSLEKMPELS